jgi:hypothetical protein
MITIEHNFGMRLKKVLNDSTHHSHWTNAQFHPIMNASGGQGCEVEPCGGFPEMVKYGDDRNHYLYPLPISLSSTAGYRKFAARVNKTLADLKVVPPLEGQLRQQPFKEVDLTKGPPAMENSKLQIRFNATTGAIASLVEKATGVEWAKGRGLGEFVYRTCK